MISKKQNYWYWREWNKAHRAEPGLDRHEVHLAALGHDKSHVDFTNSELDQVIAEFLCISEPDNLDAQIRLLKQPKTRLIYRIKRLAPPAYITKLLEDRWKTSSLGDLDLSNLNQLRNTLISRSNALRKLPVQPEHPEPSLVGATECPF